MNVTELPEYESAKAEYDGAITAAKAASDELGETRAELAWERRQNEMRTKVSEIEAHQRAVADAKAQAKAQFGRAPEGVYAHMDDPERILEIARTVHTEIVAATPQAPPEGQSGQRWPTPPSGGPPPPPAPANPLDEYSTYEKHVDAIRTNPSANKDKLDQLIDWTLEKRVFNDDTPAAQAARRHMRSER